MKSQYSENDDDLEVCCPDCGGEVAAEGEGWRCVEHSGIFIGCGWEASYESGVEPDPVWSKHDERRRQLSSHDWRLQDEELGQTDG